MAVLVPIVLTRDLLTVDGFLIGNWIYWPLIDPWLQVIITVWPLEHPLKSSQTAASSPVLSGNGGRSPSSGFPNCPRPQLPASNRNSSQGLNRSGPLTHSLTPSPNNSLHSPHRLSGWRPSRTNLLLFSLPSEDYLLMAAGPHYTTSARTAYRTPLPTARLLRQLSHNSRCLLSDSVVGWYTMVQAGRSWVRVPMRWIFSIYFIPAALWQWMDSASNRNGYQESSWG
jgi:hypothetical protein